MAYILSDKETINMLESTISQLKSANPKLKTVGNIPYRLFDVSVHETIALAAQSIDLEIHGWFDDPETEAFWADVGDTDVFPWNPMTHYQDAKGLAKQLGITVEELPDQGRTIATLGAHSVAMSHGRDWQYPQRAYCLAVTRLAAVTALTRRENANEYD